MKDQVNEPINAIDKWQKWYRANRVIPDITSKNSRESQHKTSKVMDVVPVWGGLGTDQMNWNEFFTEENFASNCKAKATEYFADTIAEFFNELSGAELFECFLAAAHNNAENAKKEHDKAQELVDLLRCK
jgi:hypothetical protein